MLNIFVQGSPKRSRTDYNPDCLVRYLKGFTLILGVGVDAIAG